MAATAATVSLIGAPFLPPPFRSAAANLQIAPTPWLSKLRFQLQPLRLPTRRTLVLRCARTESKGVSLGFRAPNFELPEPLTGKVWKLEDFEPYPALLKGLAVAAISSNSVATHPQDGPEFMAEDAKAFSYPFPYLYDASQKVARDFGAVCTPEFFLFKKDGRRPYELVYHGQFDDSRPSNNVPVTGRDLSLALDCVLSGQPVSSEQKPSVGCSIKWHP
ncbi:uncharacterized protein LOC111013532 isoform X2 [Momordica charantia]|uniref:Uncharacterized protein LOC111013532 isoform X2 n=1 Tax=Momordica charantia TaxID=3673 RepID=A0A6J1CQ28_MOMCH|nr:uncharacterized protein LOC111013532 isoform X2 [Momordica charantia]